MNIPARNRYERFVIAVFLDLSPDHWVEALRRKFDPLALRVAAHLTLVHPFRAQAELDVLASHIARVAQDARPFNLICQGITGHKSEYLFLNVKRGNDEIIALRDALYREVLMGAYSDTDTFIPHVTVGRLQSAPEFSAALADSRKYAERVLETIDAITCYGILEDGQRTVMASYKLGVRASPASRLG